MYKVTIQETGCIASMYPSELSLQWPIIHFLQERTTPLQVCIWKILRKEQEPRSGSAPQV